MTHNIKNKEIASLAGVEQSTVRVVLSGSGTSQKVRKATVALLAFIDPVAASKLEKLWPEGKKIAA